MSLDILINTDRITSELDQLAQFSDAAAPAVTRVMLSDQDLKAREYLTGLFKDAGLLVRTDPAGNLFARWEGTEPSLSAVGTGSHTDAIPFSGRFDGTVGVLGGLEAIRALQRSGVQPKRSVELVMFTSEEPTRYGVGCLGSRLMSGALGPDDAGQLRDDSDVSFDQLRQESGLSGALNEVELAKGRFHAFVELHIEQGPLLEQVGLPLGIVTDIAAPAALRVTYEGDGGHAGAVLMDGRRDALLPAAELAVSVDRYARELGGADTVATTGVLDVYPRAVNSIPSKTYLEIDVRDIEQERRDRVLAAIRNAASELAEKHRQQSTVELINADPPATCDPKVVRAIENACQAAGQPYQKMVSRAYHDSLFMAMICPTAMIFIPCHKGYSHRPEEYASPEAIAIGTDVLARSMLQLTSL